jgi:hypothetical protein
MLPPETVETVTITGTASGILDQAHTLTMNTGVDHWQSSPAPYSLRAPLDEPFVLLAAEYSYQAVLPRDFTQTFHQWYALEHTGLSGPATIDIDFGQAATTHTATGIVIELPTRQDAVLRTEGTAYAFVSSEDTGLGGTTGWPTGSELNADETAFEMSMEWVEPSTILQPRTQYLLRGGGVASWVIEHGYPVGGHQLIELLDVAQVLVPAPYGPPHPIHAPVEVEFFEPEMDARMFLFVDEAIAWIVYTRCTADSITVPLAPSTLDETQFWGTDNVQTVVQVFDVGPDELYLYRGSESRSFFLTP